MTESSTELSISWSRECLAGLTAFCAIAYIVFVQPTILASAGFDARLVFAATCIASAIACGVMGGWARYPFALAPGLGEAFFVAHMGRQGEMNPTQLMTLVFLVGVVMCVLTLANVRQRFLHVLPSALRQGIVIGLGGIIFFVGCREAGLVYVATQYWNGVAMMLPLPTQLALGGLVVCAALQQKEMPGALLIGMLFVAAVCWGNGLLHYTGIWGTSALQGLHIPMFDFSILSDGKYLGWFAIFLVMFFFDSLGSLVGLAGQAGYLNENHLARATGTMMSDAIGTMSAGVLGTSPILPFVESAAGVRAGGRSGMTAIVVALCFIATLSFFPLVQFIGGAIPITEHVAARPVIAPVMMIIGWGMVMHVRTLVLTNVLTTLPALITGIVMTLTLSIADGFAAGLISYCVLHILAGRWREVHWLLYAASCLFAVRYF